MFKLQSRFRKKVTLTLLTSFAILTLFFSNSPMSIPNSAMADSLSPQAFRLAGSTRFDTALEISRTGWAQAPAVVLARGDDFPDALAGAVLANSTKAQGPLLLTDSQTLSPGVYEEIKRLNAQKVYLLGGPGAISPAVEAELRAHNLTVQRLQGDDRYQTAAKIAQEAVSQKDQAFLASGKSFADALSVSSYAANQGIPLLLTDQKTLPAVTLDALKKLGVHQVTLVGGVGVIDPSIQKTLEDNQMTVTRMSGADRYATNLSILNTLSFNISSIYVATGEDFPDALAGAVLAAKQKNPIVLVPKKAEKLSSGTLGYVGVRRIGGSSFTLLGGVGVIPFGIESILRTGSLQSRISLQYMQAYGSSSYTTYLDELNLIPGKATDSVDIVAPHWYNLNPLASGQTVSDGSFSGPWEDSSPNYAQIVNAAHGRGLKILPNVFSDWTADSKTALDSMLQTPASRQAMIQNINSMLKRTGADGVVIDFEYMSDGSDNKSINSGPYLTQFMKELYASLHPQNKLVVEAVPARTSPTDWNQEYNYQDLSQAVDYLDIMTYDKSTSTPGPIAPLSWMKQVLDFAKKDGVPMNKVLLGMPYYGRNWSPKDTSTSTAPQYNYSSVSLSGANTLIKDYMITPQRETSAADPVGIPTLTYTDTNKVVHTVYYDDVQSWDAKLSLLDSYGLGGIGSWSLYWVNADTAKDLFPLLQRHLR